MALKTHIDFSLEYSLFLWGVHYNKYHSSSGGGKAQAKDNVEHDVKPELVRFICLFAPTIDSNNDEVKGKSGLDKLRKAIDKEEAKPGSEAYKLCYECMPQEERYISDDLEWDEANKDKNRGESKWMNLPGMCILVITSKRFMIYTE
jgi:hypothetical protein